MLGILNSLFSIHFSALIAYDIRKPVHYPQLIHFQTEKFLIYFTNVVIGVFPQRAYLELGATTHNKKGYDRNHCYAIARQLGPYFCFVELYNSQITNQCRELQSHDGDACGPDLSTWLAADSGYPKSSLVKPVSAMTTWTLWSKDLDYTIVPLPAVTACRCP